jgi:hypothetical protein
MSQILGDPSQKNALGEATPPGGNIGPLLLIMMVDYGALFFSCL